MSPQTTQVNLSALAAGAAGEQFDRELGIVLRNLMDPNTSEKSKRSIVLTLTVVPKNERQKFDYVIDVKSKLAPVQPYAGLAYVAERYGEPVAVIFDPRQNEIFPEHTDPSVTPIAERAKEVS